MNPTDGTISCWYILEVQGYRFLTGDVVEDLKGRWQTGDYMFSSAVVNMDLDSATVYTRNSVYGLVGPGEIRQVSPEHALLMRQGLRFEGAKLLLAMKQAKGEESG